MGDLMPCSPHLLSEVAIVCGLASATLGSRSSISWEDMAADYDRIRDRIEQVIPGFDDFNLRVRKKGGFYLPNNTHQGDFWPTYTGKANFTVNQAACHQLAKNRYLMMTIRTHDQYNTPSTVLMTVIAG